ncbi:hypothetical protein NEOLEDRAFT_1133404 [Neolentinus lepideus HHB14362 ss-1]|uniref:Uncharacterized protein n=1 Tax=Neolentinus lepideus HHB14362 ss-1 TaxID=1314782 RepID=A0A165SPH8_9AGAM|nr:hypothetical protein NEOLEDRAFT_1133404 [Neolentinus lepideus HHB14362 ss-1]
MPALWRRLSRRDDRHASMVRSLAILRSKPSAYPDTLSLEPRVPEEYIDAIEEESKVNYPRIELLREWENDFVLA